MARYLENAGIPTVITATAGDIIEHCGMAQLLFVDVPLGNPCGEPYNAGQQRILFEQALHLLETTTVPRTTLNAGMMTWNQGEAWKSLVFTEGQPFLSGVAYEAWRQRKQTYRDLRLQGDIELPPKVTVYSNPFCLSCEQFKHYLHQHGRVYHTRSHDG